LGLSFEYARTVILNNLNDIFFIYNNFVVRLV